MCIRDRAKGFHFDQLKGQLHLAHDEIRLSRAELRRDTGRVAGDVLYRPAEQTTEFNLAGTGIPLEKFAALQKTSMPIAGELDFNLRGDGPIRAPAAHGEIQLVGLKVGTDNEGNFRAQVESDGKNAQVTFNSEMSKGQLTGHLAIELTGDQIISGSLSAKQFDLDALITAGLHLKNLTRPSAVDGEFTISGSLRQPDSIEVKVDISEVSFDYQFVQLQNDGPIQIVYHRNEVRIERLHLHGPYTDCLLYTSRCV